jgi:hypothetical protein
MSFEEHQKAAARLRRLGYGAYVVLTNEAGKAGIGTQYPIGQIVGFGDSIGVWVRRLGQRRKSSYAAGFWQPAPKRLVTYLLSS